MIKYAGQRSTRDRELFGRPWRCLKEPVKQHCAGTQEGITCAQAGAKTHVKTILACCLSRATSPASDGDNNIAFLARSAPVAFTGHRIKAPLLTCPGKTPGHRRQPRELFPLLSPQDLDGRSPSQRGQTHTSFPGCAVQTLLGHSLDLLKVPASHGFDAAKQTQQEFKFWLETKPKI